VGSRADETMYSSGPGREWKAALGFTDAMAGVHSPLMVRAGRLNRNNYPGEVFPMWQQSGCCVVLVLTHE